MGKRTLPSPPQFTELIELSKRIQNLISEAQKFWASGDKESCLRLMKMSAELSEKLASETEFSKQRLRGSTLAARWISEGMKDANDSSN